MYANEEYLIIQNTVCLLSIQLKDKIVFAMFFDHCLPSELSLN